MEQTIITLSDGREFQVEYRKHDLGLYVVVTSAMGRIIEEVVVDLDDLTDKLERGIL